MNKLLTFLLTALLTFTVGWAAEVTDVLNQSLTGITGTTYTSFSGKTSNSTAVYAGQCAGGNSSIQLRSSNNSSGVVTTASGGKVKSITVTWNTNTAAGRKLNVYGKNSAYSAATDLYDNNAGTLIGTIDYGSTTSLTITDDYEFIGFRSSSGALYLDEVRIVWDDGGSVTPAEPNVYRKVTSTSELVAGNQYIFVYESGSSSAAMGEINSSTHHGAGITGLTIDADNKIDIGGKDVLEFTLGGSSGAWTFMLPDGKYLASNTTNSGFSSVSGTSYSDTKWSISNSFRVYNNAYTNYYVRFYTYSSVFQLSNSSTDRVLAYLYVKDNGTTPVTITPPAFSIDGSSVTGSLAVDYGTAIDITADSGNMLSYTTDGSDPATSSTATLTDGNTAQVIITEGCTLRAIALDDDANESEESTLTVTLNPLVLTLNPASDSAVTGETITVGVTANTAGDIDYEYSCSPAGATVTATAGGFSITASTAGTYTVTVEALEESGREAVATGTYTFTDPAAGNWYKKVTDFTRDLVPGKQYIIVCEDYDKAMGPVGSNGAPIDVTITSDNKVNIAGTTVVELTLGGSTASGWTFDTGSDNYLNWTSGNTLSTSSDSSDGHSRWTIDENVFSLRNYYEQSRVLQYNSSSPRFACYTTSQKTAVLYVKESNDPIVNLTPESQTVELPVGASSITATITTSGEHLSGSATVSVSGEGFAVSPETLTAEQVMQGATITVTYNGTTGGLGYVTVTCGEATATAVVAVTQAVPTAPVITFAADPCYDDQTVTITAQEGTTIYYTTDGSEPTTGSTVYNAPFTIGYGTAATTVKAIAVAGTTPSTVATGSFAWGTVTVSLSPVDGSTFQGSTMTGTVTVEPSDAQVSLTGATYDAASHTFTVVINQVGVSATVTAVATKGNVSESATATYTRVAAPAPAAPTFSVAPGAVDAGTELTITAPTGCILYVNGEAYPSGTLTVTINNAVTYQAYCVNDEGQSSSTVTNFYTIRGNAGGGANVYRKVTSTSLTDGGAYIIVHENGASNSVAMGELNSNSKGTAVTGITLNTDVTPYEVDLNGNQALELTAHATATAGVYTFGASDGYLANTSGTNFRISETGDNWIVEADGTSGYFIHHTVGTTDRCVLYNSTVFGPYARSNASQDNYFFAYLYEKVSTQTPVVVEAPVIVPESGTYFDSQAVTITAEPGTTIYYTTDGSAPTTMSSRYNGEFTANYFRGGTTTIRAIAIDANGVASEVTTVTYNWGILGVTIVPGSTLVTEPTTLNVALVAEPGDATIYYTTDGSTPTRSSAVYSGPFDVMLSSLGDEVTVKAIATTGSQTTGVVTATYCYIENTVDMTDPYFSPLSDRIYYGDQTVEILCPIPGATMYYEIAEATGTEQSDVPDASTVVRPSRGSTRFDTPIALVVGHSYYIKAVAYVGNNVSNIIEGWYIIKPTSEWNNTTGATTVLENVSQLRDISSGEEITFRNPVQVVYMSKFTNDSEPAGFEGAIPEFCYVRDNTGYGVIYFGKAATEWANQTAGRTYSPAHIFEMGDWIDGSLIKGTTGTWSSGLIPQVGTNAHNITHWPAATVGHTRIMAEPTTCLEINEANTVNNNLCGHYVHLRGTTIDWAEDQNPTAADPDYRNFGRYTDGTATASMYDRFWLFSGNGQTYTYNNHTYTLRGVGDYNTAFFQYYQDKGATFDIFAIGAYYTGNFTHNGETEAVKSEILPIDYLWIYPPSIVTPTEPQYEGTATIEIGCDTVSWSENTPKIYYRTDDMEDWAVYEGPFEITSSTTVYSYVELPAVKADGTDYSDFIYSNVVEAHYTIIGIDDPVINPGSQLIDITDGPRTLNVTVTTGEGCTSTTGVYYTVYTTDGTTPYWNSTDDFNGTVVEGGAGTQDAITINETTTVTAITYYVVDGEVVLTSNVESETYTFVKKNGVKYSILKNAPQPGTIVVIVNKASDMAMSTTQNPTNRGSVGVIFTDAVKDTVFGNDEMAQFVVERAGSGRYLLKNVNGSSTGYLYVEGNTASLLTEATLDAEGKAMAGITIGAYDADPDKSYKATVTYAAEGNSRYLRYYTGGHSFSTYTDAAIHGDVFLYGIEATPLSYIEQNKHQGDHVVVSDQLIGAWAIVKNDGTRLLWVKDQGNQSIIPTYNDAQALDYMKQKWPLRTDYDVNHDWDQSNWAVIDFSKQPTVNPETYVNKVIQGSTIVGTYSDALNYTITLDATSEGGIVPVAMDQAEGYYGYQGIDGDPTETQYSDYAYNQYIPVNFLEKNMNDPWGPGAAAGPEARAAAPGTPMFFMNPKVMEVAHVWAVYNEETGLFDMEANENGNNGYDLDGAFEVASWNYNRLSDNSYGPPEAIVNGQAYLFHAVVMRHNYGYGYRLAQNSMLRAPRGSEASATLGVYPLDFPTDGGNITAVTTVVADKQVVGVSYFNLMGAESNQPFEGINIVVTRYSDGSAQAVKVLY